MIHDRFGFGGYGSDHEDRAELLSRGAERGRELHGDGRAAIVVIGDTLYATTTHTTLAVDAATWVISRHRLIEVTVALFGPVMVSVVTSFPVVVPAEEVS